MAKKLETENEKVYPAKFEALEDYVERIYDDAKYVRSTMKYLREEPKSELDFRRLWVEVERLLVDANLLWSLRKEIDA